MPNDPAVTVAAFAHHSVSATQSRRTIDKEEVFGYFETTWRGQGVRVTMKASRYVPSSGQWTEWRVYAEEARYFDPEHLEDRWRGAATTPNARTNLADRCRPLMEAWLEGRAVEQHADYGSSRRDAFARFIRGELRELKPYEHPTTAVRALIETYRHELEPAKRSVLYAACDAFDAWAAAYIATDGD